jgi:hypothetical protein
LEAEAKKAGAALNRYIVAMYRGNARFPLFHEV